MQSSKSTIGYCAEDLDPLSQPNSHVSSSRCLWLLTTRDKKFLGFLRQMATGVGQQQTTNHYPICHRAHQSQGDSETVRISFLIRSVQPPFFDFWTQTSPLHQAKTMEFTSAIPLCEKTLQLCRLCDIEGKFWS